MADDAAVTSEGDAPGRQSIQLTEDDIAGALVAAFQARNVAIDTDRITVSTADGLY